MSKHTRYFDDYVSAYNYYGGTEIPSNEIALIGNASYIFVSSDNSYNGGNTQYFDANMTNDTIVNTMVSTSYDSGYEAGTAYGEAIGYTTGHAAGYEEGYAYGYSEGEASGGSANVDTFAQQASQLAFHDWWYNTIFDNWNGQESAVITYENTNYNSLPYEIVERISTNSLQVQQLYIDKIGTSYVTEVTEHQPIGSYWIGQLTAGDKIGVGVFNAEETSEEIWDEDSQEYVTEYSFYSRPVYMVDRTGNHWITVSETANYKVGWDPNGETWTDPVTGTVLSYFIFEQEQ